MDEVKNFHVAWADRVGLNKQWSRDIQSCCESFGTPLYPDMVRRFRSNIPNIGELKLRDMIDLFVSEEVSIDENELLDKWRVNYPQLAMNDSYVLQKQDEIKVLGAELIYRYMLQVLQDNGFLFYESNVEEDEMQ